MSEWWTYVRPPSPEPEPLIQLPLTKENIEKHNSGKMVIQILHKIGKGPGKKRRIYWMRYRKNRYRHEAPGQARLQLLWAM